MPEPTLVQVFGPGANQDVNTVVRSKTDLATVGLTAAANNRAEAIFVAELLLAKQYLNAQNQADNPDIQIVMEDGFPSIVVRNGQRYRQTQIVVNLQVLEPDTTIDPDLF
jgi:hypothetical protein